MENLYEIKSRLLSKLNVIFDYPYYPQSAGEYGINYIVLDDNVVFSSKEKHVLKQIVHKIANTLILKIYDPDFNNIEIHKQKKNDLVYEDAFTFLFDESFKWIIIQDAREDMFIFIGSDLIKIVKAVIRSWHDATIIWPLTLSNHTDES